MKNRIRVLRMDGAVEEIREDENGWRTAVRLNKRGRPLPRTERPVASESPTGLRPWKKHWKLYALPDWAKRAVALTGGAVTDFQSS